MYNPRIASNSLNFNLTPYLIFAYTSLAWPESLSGTQPSRNSQLLPPTSSANIEYFQITQTYRDCAHKLWILRDQLRPEHVGRMPYFVSRTVASNNVPTTKTCPGKGSTLSWMLMAGIPFHAHPADEALGIPMSRMPHPHVLSVCESGRKIGLSIIEKGAFPLIVYKGGRWENEPGFPSRPWIYVTGLLAKSKRRRETDLWLLLGV